MEQVEDRSSNDVSALRARRGALVEHLSFDDASGLKLLELEERKVVVTRQRTHGDPGGEQGVQCKRSACHRVCS